jgi:hypothetical protein
MSSVISMLLKNYIQVEAFFIDKLKKESNEANPKKQKKAVKDNRDKRYPKPRFNPARRATNNLHTINL